MGHLRKLLWLLCIALVAGIFLYFQGHQIHHSPPNLIDTPTASALSVSEPVRSVRAASNQTPTVAAPSVAQAITTNVPQHDPPYQFGSRDALPAMEPATVLSNMRIVLNQYGSTFGGNPVGSNAEITQLLNGGNSKQVKFINGESGLRINGQGELVDYWGTPFFFHQLSGTQTEIRSAGPDKTLWTSDDLVIK